MQRDAVVRVLTKECNFSSSKAKKIEGKIYDATVKLSEDSESSIDELYNRFAFEKIGEFVANPELVSSIIEDIDNGIEGWESCIYATLRRKEESETQEQAAGMKVTKGEFKCRNYKCKSDECYYYQTQSRSLDEPATVHVICTKCGSRYSF